MRILKSPQVRADEKRFEFEFSGEVITAVFDDITDVFDFSGFPDGEVDFSMIETVLECNPILKAQRVDGTLSVKLLDFISEDASEMKNFQTGLRCKKWRKLIGKRNIFAKKPPQQKWIT